MEDFIRLNLNTIICNISVIILLIISLIVILKIKDKFVKKYLIIAWNSVLAICIIVFIGIILSQLSVNQLKKSEIDRDYTKQSQDSYQQRVLKNSEEKKQ
jgi:hypothetical protein